MPDGATSGDTSDQLTHMTLRKVLVTRVQIDESAAADTPDDSADEANLTKPADAPTSNLLITLAIDDVNTERLVWAAEHGLEPTGPVAASQGCPGSTSGGNR